MRINFILPPLGESGGTKVIFRYAEELRLRGHSVYVYLPVTGLGLNRYSNVLLNWLHNAYSFLKGLLEIVKNPNKGHYILRGISLFVRDADVTIATAWPTAYVVQKLSSSKGKKFYFIQDFEIWDNRQRGLQSYKLPLKKIVISEWINDQLKENLDIGPFPVVHNGLDSPEQKEVSATKDPYSILMLNHRLSKKGVKYGLEAFRLAKREEPKIHLTMFGMNDSSNLPRDLDIRYFQNPSILLLQQLYQEAAIFIFPSIEEGWGLTPLEAMSYGNVVIGSDVGFAKEIGLNGENMLISSPRDSKSMAANMVKVIRNESFRELISKQAKKTTRALDWEKSAELFEKIIVHSWEEFEC